MTLKIYKPTVILVITLFSSISLLSQTDCEKSIQTVNTLLGDSLSRRGNSWLSYTSLTVYDELFYEMTHNENCFVGKSISVLEFGVKTLKEKQDADSISSSYSTLIHVRKKEGGFDKYNLQIICTNKVIDKIYFAVPLRHREKHIRVSK